MSSIIKSIMLAVVLFVVPLLFLSAQHALPTVSAEESVRVAMNGSQNAFSGRDLQQDHNPAHQSVFGAQLLPGAGRTSVITTAVEANLSWIHYDGTNRGLLWSNVEAEQGVRDWDQMALFEEEISKVSAAGLIPIVVVRSTPTWAQKNPGRLCGAIREDALDDFADFMRQLVERYSGAPYNVTYWEIWNEPDIHPGLVPSTSYFGCWGNNDDDDEYYGGGYYADMLKHVYPAMKGANPNVQLVTGGLNLDCDPTNPPPNKDCKPAKFLEGILQNGGGDYFDIVAYHAYSFWWATASGDWDLEHGYWKDRGGVTLGKADFLREVMAQFGYQKPLILTETSLLCYNPKTNPDCPGEQFFGAQANYVIRLYTRLWANNILGGTWFTLSYNGWRASDLFGPNNTPKPAYQAMQFMASLLSGATYGGSLGGSLGSSTLEGYSFLNASTNTQYQIYWTNDQNTTETLTLPPSTRKVYDKLGEEIAQSATSATIEVGFEPIIIEMDARFIYLPL
ncbi:MAG: hypothetical protein ACPGWR_03140, partial [Ardenticatenaceae bacterium]